MKTNIQDAKIELIQWLTTLEDSALIEKILELKKYESENWWHELSEAEQRSIELGVSDAENNRLNPNSEAKKIYGRWL